MQILLNGIVLLLVFNHCSRVTKPDDFSESMNLNLVLKSTCEKSFLWENRQPGQESKAKVEAGASPKQTILALLTTFLDHFIKIPHRFSSYFTD